MNRQEALKYYSRGDITNELIRNAKGREVAGCFADGSYDSRPNILQYPNDIVQMVRKGVTSFHYSAERWKNPMAIASGNYDSLRIGWDLILDLDSKIGMDGSRIAAETILDFFGKYGIKNAGIKFSGSRGFHLCLPWEMFPRDEELVKRYPEIPQALIGFIKNSIAEELMKRLVREKSAKELISVIELPELNPFYFVGIEKWGSRHMFRAPYSLNEKTWLVSLPISHAQLRDFSTEIANPEKIKIKEAFLLGEKNEAESLLIDAMDWNAMQKKEEKKKPGKERSYYRKINENLFPPCIKNILAGMPDGRKRSVFTLASFLRMCNWSWQEIESKIWEWNERNTPPLQRNIVLSQLRWNEINSRTVPNCDNETFIVPLGICKPDDICDNRKIRNPINYPFRKMAKRKKEGVLYKCSKCDKGFKTMGSLNIHIARMHT